MHGYRPGGSERVLGELPYDLLLDFVGLLVQGVPFVFPDVRIDLGGRGAVGKGDYDLLPGQLFYFSDFSVEVAAFAGIIVLDEHDLGVFLQFQPTIDRVQVRGEIPLDFGFEKKGLSRKLFHRPCVDVVGLFVVRGDENMAVGGFRVDGRVVVAVQKRNVPVGHPIFPKVVQKGYEDPVGLAVDFFQFDVHRGIAGEGEGVEKIKVRIPGGKEVRLFALDHRRKLEKVPDEQDLHAAEGRVAISPYRTKHRVDGVQEIGSKHAHLVDNQKFQFAQEAPFGSVHLQGVQQGLGGVDLQADVFGGQVFGGHESAERKLEQGMQGDSLGVDRRDSGGGGHHGSLVGAISHSLQKGRLSRPRLSRQKYVAVRAIDKPHCGFGSRICFVAHGACPFDERPRGAGTVCFDLCNILGL